MGYIKRSGGVCRRFSRDLVRPKSLEDLKIYGGSYGIYSVLEDCVKTWRDLSESGRVCRKGME